MATKTKLGAAVDKAKANQTKRTSGSAPHVMVKARAGTGKTFTLVLALAFLFWAKLKGTVKRKLGFLPEPSPQQAKVWEAVALEKPRFVTYVAFNRSIVEEFKVKWKWLPEALSTVGVTFGFSTIHQMGFRACGKAYKVTWRDIEKFKVRDLLEREVGRDLREVMKTESGTMVEAVESLVGLAKLTLAHDVDVLDTEERVWCSDESLTELADLYGVALNGQRETIFAHVNTVLELSRTETDKLDFDDMIWLPVVNRLDVFVNCLLLVDEAQDLNPCQQALALRCGGRLVLCGDDRQTIYGFAGADPESLPRMGKKLKATKRGLVECPLTVTYRCGKSIVREAQKLVPDFSAHEDNEEGTIRTILESELFDELTDRDMVPCRTNAPLVALAFKLLKHGRKANIQGRDIGNGLKALVKKSKKKTVEDFLEWLDSFYQSERTRMEKRRKPSEEALVALQDRVSCLRIFAEGATTLKEIDRRVDELFKGKDCPKCKRSFGTGSTHCSKCKGGDGAPVELVRPEGVLLTSVHRAKGMEADRVFILKPSQFPHPMAKTEMAVAQEYNLKYVAITRAIRELVWVEEEPGGPLDSPE